MNNLENIKHGIADGTVSIEKVNQAVIDGIKLHYGTQDLHFYFGYKPGDLMDAYGLLPGFTYGFGQTVYNQGEILMCSTKVSLKYVEINRPDELYTLLGGFSRGKMKVYFVDTGKEYNILDELKHDHLAFKLSGLEE